MVLAGPQEAARDPRHAQEEVLCLIIVVCGLESEKSDVLAMHTIEMIPKSMILTILAIEDERISLHHAHLAVCKL